jgi:hypothetical protein
LVRTLEFLGLPRDFTLLVSNLYSGATTQFITAHGHTPPVEIGRGTLQGDPLSPLLFDLMVEPLIRWLNAVDKGYDITSCGLKLSSKWYADDGTLVTNSVADMISLLSIVQQFSDWSGIQLNVDKCKVTAYIHSLQTISRKNGRDDALRARLAHITLSGRPIGSLTQDEPLPGGYLGTSLTASLSPAAHLHWTKEQLNRIGKALKNTPLPPHIKQRLLLYGAHSKITHTHCLMALSPTSIQEVDAVIESISREIWKLPASFPKAGLHALLDEVGLNIPSVWEDYCGAAVRSWTQILNDEGALGATARASLHRASNRFRHWPIELAFHTFRNKTPACKSIMARNMATLLLADLHPTGGPEIWSSGNRISTTITSHMPIQLDEDGCPIKTQAFPTATSILKRLTPLWDHGILDWKQILAREPDGRPYFLDDRELKWANPSMDFPLPQDLTQALKYLRTLLSSKNPEDWHRLKTTSSGPESFTLSIAPRWRTIFTTDWHNIPDRPSPLAVSRASRQLTITEAMGNIPPHPARSTRREGTRLVLHFNTKRPRGPNRKAAFKRQSTPITEPLRDCDAPGENASILSVLARAEPRRNKHNRRFTHVEEFLVQWGPEICTLDEAQEQYIMGFDIVSIASLDSEVPSTDLQQFVSVKRLTTQQRRRCKQPPPTTRCLVQFAPSPQGPEHIRSI